MKNWIWTIKGYYTPDVILYVPTVGQWIYNLREAANKKQK